MSTLRVTSATAADCLLSPSNTASSSRQPSSQHHIGSGRSPGWISLAVTEGRFAENPYMCDVRSAEEPIRSGETVAHLDPACTRVMHLHLHRRLNRIPNMIAFRSGERPLFCHLPFCTGFVANLQLVSKGRKLMTTAFRNSLCDLARSESPAFGKVALPDSEPRFTRSKINGCVR